MNKNTKMIIGKVLGSLVLIISIPLLLYCLWLFVGASIYGIKEGQSSGVGLGQMYGAVGAVVFACLAFLGGCLFFNKKI